MIEIKCAESNAETNEYIYAMCDRGEVIGKAIAHREGNTVHLLRCEAPDAALTDALFRAVLNAERKEGVTEAVSEDADICAHAAKKGYTEDFFATPLIIKEFFSKFVCKG